MPSLDPTCILYAPVVSWIADFFKRFPFLKKYPKLVALFLGFVAAWIKGLILGPVPIGELILCALATLGGSIATHEVITEPLSARIKVSDAR